MMPPALKDKVIGTVDTSMEASSKDLARQGKSMMSQDSHISNILELQCDVINPSNGLLPAVLSCHKCSPQRGSGGQSHPKT